MPTIKSSKRKEEHLPTNLLTSSDSASFSTERCCVDFLKFTNDSKATASIICTTPNGE